MGHRDIVQTIDDRQFSPEVRARMEELAKLAIPMPEGLDKIDFTSFPEA